MKNKLPIKQQVRRPTEQQQSQLQSQQAPQQAKIEDIAFRPRLVNKNSLYITFSGMIETGTFDDFKSLVLEFDIVAGPGWKRLNGELGGRTQVGAALNDKIVWNYPFEVTYETTALSAWPQIIVVLHGTDFFGKNFVKGYGNVHLPTSGGVQNRKIRVFCPQPRSIISGILGYFQGCIAQYRDVERVLAYGDGREVTRTRSVGFIDIKVQTAKFNFTKFGYE